MAINFDKALGLHEESLNIRRTRTELIASNIANADTPGYKARDIDFRTALADVSLDNLSLNRTDGQHIFAGRSSRFKYSISTS